LIVHPFLKPVSSATSAAVDMDGPEIAIVTKGLKKFCPFTGICAKVLDGMSQKMEIAGRLSPILP
jgi:hypothetical protein